MNAALIFKSKLCSFYIYKIHQYLFYITALLHIFFNFKDPVTTIKKITNKSFPLMLETKNGKKISVQHKSHLSIVLKRLEDIIDFGVDTMIINSNGKKLTFSHYDTLDIGIFTTDIYSKLPVKDKIVIDVGGNIGDSSILFATMGAKEVIMLEPQPKFFEYASRNIEYNDMSGKIQIVNSALGGRSGIVKINYEKSGEKFQIPFDDDGMDVPMITLDEILSKYNDVGLILKMDCEGCEYDVIDLSSDEVIKKFDAILIEFHAGCLNIQKRLESCGFKVSILNSMYTKQKTFQGHLLAKRNSL